jgi:hypothetical protein
MVFVDGKLRRLRPYPWWSDPSVFQKRMVLFRELVSAIGPHPALSGWLIMDKALEWARPDRNVADLIVRATVTEIREKDEAGPIFMSSGWMELLHPQLVKSLSGYVNGFHLGGLDKIPSHFGRPPGLVGELMMAAYMVSLGRWFFSSNVEIEAGWTWPAQTSDLEEVAQTYGWLAEQGPAGIVFPTLVDPDPTMHHFPPWSVRPELRHIGLMDRGLEPKENAEALIHRLAATAPKEDCVDFIDVSKDEYGSDPEMHFPRLWDHFREWIS